jgi:hypothetical protein
MDHLELGEIESINRKPNLKTGCGILDIVVVNMKTWSKKGELFRNQLQHGMSREKAVSIVPQCDIYPWDFYLYQHE